MADTHTPVELRPILAAVDLTPASGDVFAFALNLSEQTGAPLTVMHSVHEPADSPGFYYRGRGSQRALPMQLLARQMLDELVDRACVDNADSGASGALRTVVVEGLPGARILDVADRVDASIIVLGSNGRTGMTRMVLGSVVDYVSRRSPLPVTIVRSTWRGWELFPDADEREVQIGAHAMEI